MKNRLAAIIFLATLGASLISLQFLLVAPKSARAEVVDPLAPADPVEMTTEACPIETEVLAESSSPVATPKPGCRTQNPPVTIPSNFSWYVGPGSSQEDCDKLNAGDAVKDWCEKKFDRVKTSCPDNYGKDCDCKKKGTQRCARTGISFPCAANVSAGAVTYQNGGCWTVITAKNNPPKIPLSCTYDCGATVVPMPGDIPVAKVAETAGDALVADAQAPY